MRGFLHLTLGDKRLCFHMIVEVTVRKGDVLGCCQEKKREERVSTVAACSTREVTDVVQGFVILLLRQVRHFDQRLKYRTVLTG